jgi:hypothetical protein
MENVQTTDALARERVARLLENWDWPDPAILEEIAALGEAAIPAIQDALTPELLADTHVDDQAAATAYYLAEVSGLIGSPRAIPLLVEMFRWVDDETIESLPDILLPLGPAAINGLLSTVCCQLSLPHPSGGSHGRRRRKRRCASPEKMPTCGGMWQPACAGCWPTFWRGPNRCPTRSEIPLRPSSLTWRI